MDKPSVKKGREKTIRPWGVRVKLLLSFVLLILFTTAIFFSITYTQIRKMAEEHMNQKISLLATVFSAEIEREITNVAESLEKIAGEPAVREMKYTTLFRYYFGKHFNQLRPDAVFIYGPDMYLRYSSFPNEHSFVPHDWPAGKKAVARAIKERVSIVFTAPDNYERPGTFFVATPILDSGGKPAGVVIGEKAIDSSTMEHIVAGLKTSGEGMRVFLIDRDGKILTHTNPKMIGISAFREDMVMRPLRGKWRKLIGNNKTPQVNFSFEGRGGKYIGAATLVEPLLGWRVAIVQPFPEAIEPVRKVSAKIIFWGAVALLVAVYIALYRARRITKPISDLIQAVGEISRGDYSKRVRIYRRDEFGALAFSFNRMSAVLEEKIAALQVSQAQLEEAYNQLQNDARKREEANREMSRKVKELTSLSEVTQTISNSLNLNTVLDTIVDTINNVMGFTICSIKLIDKDTSALKIEMSRGLGREYEEKGPTQIGEGISGLAVKMCRPIVVDDIEIDPRVPQNHILRRLGIRSVVSIPLIAKKSVMGVINLYSSEKHEFTGDELRLLGIFANQAAGAIENARLFDSLRDSYLNTIRALSMAIDAKDRYTHGHSKRVSNISVAIGRGLGLSREKIELLEYAGDLHDIGKIGISEVIISKEGKLTVDEYEIIKTHPLVGETIIEPVPFLQEARPVIRHHHERYDGYGYPDGLKGEEIPLLSRIIHIADAYDAMTSDRPYRKALSHEAAVKEIKKHTCTQFDPKVVEAFVRVFDKSQPGEPLISS